jgi:hypothetical protein
VAAVHEFVARPGRRQLGEGLIGTIVGPDDEPAVAGFPKEQVAVVERQEIASGPDLAERARAVADPGQYLLVADGIIS